MSFKSLMTQKGDGIEIFVSIFSQRHSNKQYPIYSIRELSKFHVIYQKCKKFILRILGYWNASSVSLIYIYGQRYTYIQVKATKKNSIYDANNISIYRHQVALFVKNIKIEAVGQTSINMFEKSIANVICRVIFYQILD